MNRKLVFLVLPALFVFFGAGCDLTTDFSKVVRMQIDAPEAVAMGDEFNVLVTLTNTDTKPYMFYDLEIGDTLLEGLALKGADPLYETANHLPIFGLMFYSYDTEIPAGESFEVVLTFEALQAGTYDGALNACVGDDANCIDRGLYIVVE